MQRIFHLPTPRPADEAGGFSLTELAVAVAILAIIGAIATPALSGYISNAKLTEAKENLQVLTGLVERSYQDNGVYPTTATTAATQTALAAWKPGNNLLFDYTITGTATTYTITATAKSGNGINGYVLTINQRNQRQYTLNGGSTQTW